MSDNWKQPTRAVHAGTRRSGYGEMSEALFLTQGFAYESAGAAEARFVQQGDDEYIYARYGNPTVRMFEERMAALEGAEDAFATASGMAAVNAALTAPLGAGDRVVAARALFGSCLYILQDVLARFGVEVVLVDGADIAGWRAALKPGANLVFFESLANPTLELVDIAAVSRLAHAAGALVVVDNTFATGILSRPLEMGADAVIYSATKHVDGQGRCLGGVILGGREFIRSVIAPYMKHTGAALSPFSAWVLLKGLETLDLRVRAQAANAGALARALAGHEKLARVIWPGLPGFPQSGLAARQMAHGGTMLTLDVNGGKAGAFRFLDALRLFTITNNLGDAKSLVTHPATTTHQRLSEDERARLGITPGMVRMSLGLEDADDLIADVMQALKAV